MAEPVRLDLDRLEVMVARPDDGMDTGAVGWRAPASDGNTYGDIVLQFGSFLVPAPAPGWELTTSIAQAVAVSVVKAERGLNG